jgi:hydroxymethylpyrimidine pyrophosphatase-like HAD family hydrolase
VRPLLDELGGAGLAVCGQGAQLYDAAADRLLWSVTLDRELAETAIGKIEAEVGLLYAAVDQDGVDGLTLIEPGYVMPHPTLPAVRVHHRDDLWTKPISKVLLRHPSLSDDELASAARSVVGSLATVTMSGPGTVELQPCGVTKATGLALAAAHLGLTSAATIAFGDMPNDIPMFDWAAHGVAMANAHPELKAVADEVTLSNEDDGIAVVLERLFPCPPVQSREFSGFSESSDSRESSESREPSESQGSGKSDRSHSSRQASGPLWPRQSRQAHQPYQSYQ